MHALSVLAIAVVTNVVAQQTFQSTLFDLPAELPAEDYVLLSQLEDASRKEIKDIEKPKKIDKAALNLPQVEHPPEQSAFTQPHTVPPPPSPITPTPFSFSTFPTIAQPALPSHFTMAPLSLPLNLTPSPFMLPTHASLSPVIFPAHPTLPPFSFPTHPTITPFTVTPPPQLQPAEPAQFPHLQHFGAQSQVIQPPQQQNNVQTTFFQTPTNNPPYYGLTQSQEQVQQPILQPQQQLQQSGNVQQQQLPYREWPQQQPSFQSQFPQMQQLVRPPPLQQQQPYSFQQQYGENYYQQTTHPYQYPQSYGPTQPQTPQFVQPVPQPHQFIGFQPNQEQRAPQQPYGQVVAAGHTVVSAPQLGSSPLQAISTAQNAEKQKGQVERVSNSTPNRVSIWFKEEFNTTECEKNLTAIAEKFREKFPAYLRKGGKDDALADLVEQRLMECDRKSSASHWDKVDKLLSKLSLSKSEESECRSGLVQERISCLNLLHYACQLIDPSFTFRLVPARITIQEARQAEDGAEKCRKVVRLVKKRLEG